MKLASSFLKQFSGIDFRGEQGNKISLGRTASINNTSLLTMSVAGVFTNHSQADHFFYSTEGEHPAIVSGYAVDPTDSLITNGEFDKFTFRGSTEFEYDDWVFYGTPFYQTNSLIGEPNGYLWTNSGPYDATMLSVSAKPLFNTEGKLVNDVVIESLNHLGWKQTVPINPGEQYLLQFDSIGRKNSESLNFVDGLFVVKIGDYDELVLRSDANADVTYQLLFDTTTSQIDIGFMSLGFIDSRRQNDELIGWDIEENSISSDGGWDNVTMTLVPEPSLYGIFLGIIFICYGLFKRFNN